MLSKEVIMKFLVKCLLVSSMAMTVASAGEKIFDLRDQYFSETMKNNDNAKIGIYDLPKVTVNTNTVYYTTDKVYAPRKYTDTAFMLLNIKQPLTDWIYQETKIYDRDYRDQATPIKFSSNSGNSFFINVGANQISINGKSFDIKMPDDATVYSINVEKTGDILTTSINGKELLKANIQTFGNLSKIETTMLNWGSGQDDQLRSLELYTK